ncbi:DcaP family trimeric outer membrane transporter [Pontibacter sp. G13]|uniref:DcaP family trimeric outer membrane transporter n=1 Tax=Pontibacter sp. G13 TaxID=3074898 RepID=UPI002889C1D3|nr:DcaP family trimeric outer membrane transporter [Pontibacter sp. G13]WNJ18188.1 DcaP family trimeric outer membrane transporter [Pontibacter sp. G13]
MIRIFSFLTITCLLLILFPHVSLAQFELGEEGGTRIYGHVMTDIGYNFGRINPSWFDVMRPSQLPTAEDQFGTDGNWYFSVRQTRFGVEHAQPTDVGQLKLVFEWELFGVGADAGQTTFRLRHAYGELGRWGAGQYWSVFMDIGIFPNSIEYWGPNGMILYRNIQLRYKLLETEKAYANISIEQPGASGDGGQYADSLALQDLNPRFPMPDIALEYHRNFNFGYVELAGIVRYITWEDQNQDSIDLSNEVFGWGLNLTTNVNVGEKNTIRAGFVVGDGIQNYMNDGGPDIGIENQFSNPSQPIKGVTQPLWAFSAFLDRTWNERFTSSIGYAMAQIDVASGQDGTSLEQGRYGLANVLFHPTRNMLTGVELQYGGRRNFNDFTYDLLRVQFSFKYIFSSEVSLNILKN